MRIVLYFSLTSALAAIVAGQPGSCRQVDHAMITAGDIAAALTGSSNRSPNPARPVAPSPAPGTIRSMKADEAARIAGLVGLNSAHPEICFERVEHEITGESVVSAMASAFSGRPLTVELVDFYPKRSVPGRIEFRLSGLSRPAFGKQRAPQNTVEPVKWRGTIVHPEGGSTPLHATVRLVERVETLIAVKDLEPGALLQAEDLERAFVRRFPLEPETTSDLAAVGGRSVRSPVAARQPVQQSLLVKPYLVRAGEVVTVVARRGPLTLEWKSKSRGWGRAGETIVVEAWATPESRDSRPAVPTLVRAQVVSKGTLEINIP